MLTFKHPYTGIGGKKPMLKLYLNLLLSALCIIWLSQNSINHYWQQTYHRNSPIMPLNHFSFWRIGGEIQRHVYNGYSRIKNRIADIDQQIIANTQKTAAPQQTDNEFLTVLSINSNPPIFTQYESSLSEEKESNVDIDNQEETGKETKHAPLIISARDFTQSQTSEISNINEENQTTTQQVTEIEPVTQNTTEQENSTGKTLTLSSNADTENKTAEEIKHPPLLIGARDFTQSQTSETSNINEENKTTTQQVTEIEPVTQNTTEQENSTRKLLTLSSNADTENKTTEEIKHPPLLIGARDFTQSQTNEILGVTRQYKNTEPSAFHIENNKPHSTQQKTVESKPIVQSAPKTENTQKTDDSSAKPQTVRKENKEYLFDSITLQLGDKILFAGDSLMQGVAPHVQKWLQHEHGIKSINLSKQSTGLSYPDFFDWPTTIENTLKRDAAIKAVVIFLGPNDPWDFPNPQNRNAPYLKFKTQAWEDVYRKRIDRILDSAAQHNVAVIWLGIPFMKDNQLNEKMNYLDAILRNEVQNNAIFVPTKYILTDGKPHYVDTIVINGKPVRMRSKDGTHFTIRGQKQLATAIRRRFSFTTN